MNLKNNTGFTIIEVLLALAIVAMVLTPIFILQAGAAQTVSRRSKAYDRFVAAYSFLVSSAFVPEPKEQATKQITNLRVELNYESKKITANSTLKDIPQLQMNTVSMQWQERNRKKEDKIVAITFKQEEKEA